MLTEAMPQRLQLMVTLASWCALRFGEIVELRRGDIDLSDEVIRIRRAAVRRRRVARLGDGSAGSGRAGKFAKVTTPFETWSIAGRIWSRGVVRVHHRVSGAPRARAEFCCGSCLSALLLGVGELGQQRRDFAVPARRGVLIAHRGLWGGVPEAGHQLGQTRPGRGRQDGTAVAQVVEA